MNRGVKAAGDSSSLGRNLEPKQGRGELGTTETGGAGWMLGSEFLRVLREIRGKRMREEKGVWDMEALEIDLKEKCVLLAFHPGSLDLESLRVTAGV